MKKLVAILSVLLAVSGSSCAQSTSPIDVSGLTEASMNFDQDGVGPFLTGLSNTLGSGLDARQAKELSQAIDALPLEQSGSWEYTVTANGRPERLVVVAFKDDLDAPDLAFYSSPALAARIQLQLDAFAKAQGW